MVCIVIGKWCVSTREAPPLQEVSYRLTQSEQGADSASQWALQQP